MLALHIAMDGAHTESWCDRIIWQSEIIGNFLHKLPARLIAAYLFPDKSMQDSPSGIFGLQGILVLESLKNIISVADWKVRGICVIGLLLAGCYYVRQFFPVNPCKPVGSAFCRRCLQIVNVPSFLLEFNKPFPHEIKRPLRKFLPFPGFNPLPEEIQAGLMHSHKPDCCEMVIKRSKIMLAPGDQPCFHVL